MAPIFIHLYYLAAICQLALTEKVKEPSHIWKQWQVQFATHLMGNEIFERATTGNRDVWRSSGWLPGVVSFT